MEKFKETYSINFIDEAGHSEWADSFETIQEVIECIIESIQAQDDCTNLVNSVINIYLDSEQSFKVVTNKTSSYSIIDFISDLAQLSDDLGEKEIRTVLEWISILEDSLLACNGNSDDEYENDGDL